MSMKKVVLAVAMASAMISGVQAKDLGHGDIKFTGSIIDAPCSIDGASGDQTVVLGQIAAHQMAKGGKSTPVPFFIQLHDCDTTTMKSATVTFIGAANPDSTLSDTFATVGQAKNVGVAVVGPDGKVITPNGKSGQIDLVDGDNKLAFNAYVQGSAAAGADALPGAFSASTKFMMDYQ